MTENKKMQTTQNETLSKINLKFLELKKINNLALMPFIMAGDPNIETTSRILLKLQEKGADLIELGIPYSDPLADGPIIQFSASKALKSGTTAIKVIQLLESIKEKLHIPVILFTYFNPLLKYGLENFCELASKAGVAGLIILENLEASSKGRSGIINPATPALDANSQKFSIPKFKIGLK